MNIFGEIKSSFPGDATNATVTPHRSVFGRLGGLPELTKKRMAPPLQGPAAASQCLAAHDRKAPPPKHRYFLRLVLNKFGYAKLHPTSSSSFY